MTRHLSLIVIHLAPNQAEVAPDEFEELRAEEAQDLERNVPVIGVHALSDVTGVRLGGLAIELVEHAGRAVVLVPVQAPETAASS